MVAVTPGSPVTLTSQWYEYPGGPTADLTGITITITRIAGGVVVGPTSVGISHPATGVYTYTWTVPPAQTPGDHLVAWSGQDSTGDTVSATELVSVSAGTPAVRHNSLLPPLATVEDLQAHLGRALPPAQAALAIRRASARVRSYTRQIITFSAGDTIEIPGGDRVLRIPQRPLVVDDSHPITVVEVGDLQAVDIALVEGRDYTRLGDELTRGYPWYQPTRLMGYPHVRSRGVWAPRVRLTYSHGYTSVPDDIMDVVLDLATTNVGNVDGLRSESIDDYSVTYATETVGSARLTNAHKDSLRAYRTGVFSAALS